MTKKAFFVLSIFLVTFYLIWWVLLLTLAPTHDSSFNDYFADTYGILAGVGGLVGLYISRRWDFLKSYVGKSLFFLGLGLLSQFLGQLYYTAIFYIFGIENAYPSYGEIFFLGSIPLYILGIWYIAKASGFTISIKNYRKKAIAIAIPLLLVGISYYFFLHDYQAEGLPFNIVFLDYVYPLGQALFVSLAILTYLTTNGILGGVMRNKVIFILFSLVFQYAADSLFIYETRAETWYAGGWSDLLFVLSYFLMTIGFVSFLNVSSEVKKYKEV